MFDFEDQFYYINIEDIAQWEVSIQDLFIIALQNLSTEEVEIVEHLFDSKFNVFTLLSGDYSASYTLLIDNCLKFSIGVYGIILAIPTKGTVFIHPIQNKDILDLIPFLQPEVKKFYDEDPGNISLDYYWYYQGQFHLFGKEVQLDQEILITLPTTLKQLFNES